VLLEARNLTIFYGAAKAVRALRDVSFRVEQGEIVSMIGPNGAGKSTALKAVSGMLGAYGGHIDSGDVLFEGDNIKGLRTDELVIRGLSLVPEGRRIFPTMTVKENLEMGAYTRNDKGRIKDDIDKTIEMFPRLRERMKQKAGTLSTGEQQMLAIGRALMLRPKLLLADEPSLGLSPNYVDLIFEKFVEINKGGTSILMVEQNAQVAIEICDRGYVFEIGEIALEGHKADLLNNEKIKKVYLGY
jgi:branched-chain amino acid transport system ATP-binding protein